MRLTKWISLLLVALMLCSVCSVLAPAAATTTDANEENVKIMKAEFETYLKKNGLDKKNVSFGYIDFNRELEFVYNPNRMFEANETLKFPLAYLYFKGLVGGKYRLNEDVGEDNLRTVFFRSLTKDYNRDDNATQLLIDKYGGLEQVKRGMYEITYTKVNNEFLTTTKVNARYMIDFIEKYYSEALYCSADYKSMLITPLKKFSRNRYSETYINDCAVTHRYGYSKTDSAALDMGIVNAPNPFGFFIQIEGVQDPEEELAGIAEFAYDFNLDYGDLMLSQLTTLPDVPEDDKQSYDYSKTYNTPLMIALIASTVVIATVITIVYIITENKKKNQDRLD